MTLSDSVTSTFVSSVETAYAGGAPDGYLGIQDLEAALANPSFDWGPDPRLRRSAQLVLDVFRAGDTDALQAMGFFSTADGQWLMDVQQHAFDNLYAAARAQPLPLAALDARQGTDRQFDLLDLRASLLEGDFNTSSPLARAYAESLLARADAHDTQALSREGFYADAQGQWRARVESFSYLGTHDYSGTTLTDEVLNQVWNQGYGAVVNPTTEADRARGMTLFFEHLSRDLHMDVVRFGCNWRALEPSRGAVDPAAWTQLQATLQAASEAGVKIILGVGAKSASDAWQFRNVPPWANQGFEAGSPGGFLLAGQVQSADSSFGLDVSSFVKRTMEWVARLPESVRANIVGYQIENEPLNEWGLGSIGADLLQAEAALVRAAAPGVPLVINHWSDPQHDAVPNALQQAAEVADFVGFDIYAAGTSEQTPWYSTDEQQWGLARQYQDGIPRADGSSAHTFIAELQASTWTNARSEGFVATAENVQPLIDQAQALDMNVLFWRMEDLLTANPDSRSYDPQQTSDWHLWASQGLNAVEAAYGLQQQGERVV